MIISYADKDTGMLANRIRVRRFQSIERSALRKIRQLQIARVPADLLTPPGNRLEALHGDREGQFSIRINDQYRICFVWTDLGPAQVEIVDYHKG
jgi:proteic killer suppression protein